MKPLLFLLILALGAFFVHQQHPELFSDLFGNRKLAPIAPPPVAAPPATTGPVRWYLTQRASMVTESGVAAIPIGTEVQLLSRNGSECTITDGRLTLQVSEQSLTNQPPAPSVALAPVQLTASSSAQPAPVENAREDFSAHNARVHTQLRIVDDQIYQLTLRIQDLEGKQSIAQLYGRSGAHGASISRLQRDITRLNNYKMSLANTLR